MMSVFIQDSETVNVAGSESIRAQKWVRDKKWCHISRRQISNSITFGWMSVSGSVITRSRKSSREIPAYNIYIYEFKVRWEANQNIPETISKVWHASGLENMDKILPQYFTLRCSLFHCFATHKAFSASRAITFNIDPSDGCESFFSATSTTNSRYPCVSRIRLEIEFSDLTRNACVVFTRSFCRWAKVASTRCAACGTRCGSGSVF